MGPITAILPVAREVSLAGKPYQISEFRLKDLAELQAWLDSTEPDPVAEIRDRLAEAGEAERRILLAGAHALAEAGPPTMVDKRGQDLLWTPVGITLTIFLAVRRHRPGFTPDDAAEVYAGISADELNQFRIVAFGSTVLERIERLIGLPPAPKGRSATWGEAIHAVAETLGIPYREVYEMTLTELGNARRGGKPREGIRLEMSSADLAAAVREQCHRFYGRPPEEVFGEAQA